MLFGLRLDSLVRGDDQHHAIDAAGAGQHIAHKGLVTRHIDEAQVQQVATAIQQLQSGKAKIDGDASPLFFRQAIGIGAGKRVHERGLAVIYVARRPYHHGFRRNPVLRGRRMLLLHRESRTAAAGSWLASPEFFCSKATSVASFSAGDRPKVKHHALIGDPGYDRRVQPSQPRCESMFTQLDML